MENLSLSELNNTKSINFIKMHGCGNDFMVIDSREFDLELSPEQIIKLSDYKKSIGFDQLLLIKKSNSADIALKIFNNDGKEVSACGNGSRAVAKLMLDSFKQDSLTIATTNRIITAHKEKYDMIAVNMGIANINSEEFEFPKIKLKGNLVDIGNPHIILLTKDCENINYLEYGPLIENDSRFPNKVNVNFVQVINKDKVKLITWERGAGATLACGTGASATFALLNHLGLVNNEAMIMQKGGNLYISIKNKEIFMAGEAEISYRGVINV